MIKVKQIGKRFNKELTLKDIEMEVNTGKLLVW